MPLSPSLPIPTATTAISLSPSSTIVNSVFTPITPSLSLTFTTITSLQTFASIAHTNTTFPSSQPIPTSALSSFLLSTTASMAPLSFFLPLPTTETTFFSSPPSSTTTLTTTTTSTTTLTTNIQPSFLHNSPPRPVQGIINYEVIGIFPGNNFFDVGRTDGQLRVIRDLTTDTSARSSYTLTLVAYDSALPSARGTSTVSINVLRNINAPQFSTSPIFVTVVETQPIENMIVNITATDADGDSLEFRLLRDKNNRDGLSFFYVEPFIGEMYLKRSLTLARDNTYTMVVRATDSGNPSRFTDVDVIITIQRIAAPNFASSVYNTVVPENTPPGDSVFDLIATKPGATIRYQATGTGLAPYFFAIDETTGRVSVRNNLRNFREMAYSLIVEAYDTQYPDFPGSARLDIAITRNNNEPAFNQSLYTAAVTVDTPRFSNLVTVNAEDARDGDIITYSLVGPQQCLDSFSLLSTTGQFLLVAEPNTVPVGVWDCIVRATDNGFPTPRTTDATVRVTVTTQNAPNFNPTQPITIDETNNPGQLITLTASKPNPVGQIRYEAVGVYPAQSFFSVDESTGAISLTGDLRNDPLKLTQYTLRICAYDSGFPNIRSCVDQIINVNRNQFGPSFNPSSLRIPLAVDTQLNEWSRILDVSDPDSSQLRCSIISDAKAIQFFQVDEDTCVLSLRRLLTDDPDNTTLYRITVQATDDGTPTPQTANSLIEVEVQRDRFTPGFTNLPTTVTIPENSAPGTAIFRGTLSDQDRLGQLLCESVANYPASIYFRLDPNTCQVFLENSVRSDDDLTYSIPIQVYDSAWPNNRRTATLTVNVQRNVNSPVFTGGTVASINDQFPPGDQVLRLQARDDDGDTLTFSKVNPNDPQGEPFIVDSTSGRIILIQPLSGANTYSFDVQVSDNRNPPKTATATVTINVADATFSPRWTNDPFQATININQPVNSGFNANIQATKQGVSSGIKYRISGAAPSVAENFFTINEDLGTLTLTADLTTSAAMASRSSVVLFIEAYDERVPTEVISSWVTVNFNRNLNPPEFQPTMYTGSVNDYDGPGTSVTTVSAIDNDALAPENNVLYSLDSGRAAADWFTVDSYTGLVSVRRRVSEDTARPPTYLLYVIASDPSQQPLSSTATVTISVNRNEAPRFSLPTYTSPASDSLDIFSTILVATATDPNPTTSNNGILDFSIDDPTAQSIFFIDNQGAISPRRQLDRLPQTSYIFGVTVADRGIPSLSATATVTINIRESPGLAFIPNTVTYEKPENNPVPELLEIAQATDGAAGNTILYELETDGFAQRAYTINNNTGAITQILSFTEDITRSLRYVLRVKAYRASDTSVQAYKTITVEVDRNPTTPVFSENEYFFTVRENQTLGAIFDTISASDPDTGEAGELTYTILRTSNSPLSAYTFFYVNPTTGQLSVSRSLLEDRSTSQYRFPVQVQDSGSPRKTDLATVNINVLRNQNGPVFNPTDYNVTIPEDKAPNTLVIDLDAFDADNDNVTYSLQRTATSSLYFTIEPLTGRIILSVSVLRAPTSTFFLTVTASDNQASARTAEAYVTVLVIRNPNAPRFQQGVYTLGISEYANIYTPLLTVIAEDQDPVNTDSGRITYSIINQTALQPRPTTGFDNDFFSIGANNGDLYLARPLTTVQAANEYDLYILAQDNAITPRSDIARINVRIQRNEFGPVFNPTFYSATINENFDINRDIFTVTATDGDVNIPLNADTPNAQIEYSLNDPTGNDQDRFFGVTQSGVVYKRQSTVGDGDPQTYNFTVTARDLNWRGNRFSSADISITVQYNVVVEGQIGFLQPLYYEKVKENVNQGTWSLALDVENQGEFFADCRILGRGAEKNCLIQLVENLDFEQVKRYEFNVSVTRKNSRSNGRRKRQANEENVYKYNTWPITRVIIEVEDVNDNAPQWVLVPYPSDNIRPLAGTQGIFITAITALAPAESIVTQLTATDIDSGENGEVHYALDLPLNNPPPFHIDEVEGLLITTDEFFEPERSTKIIPYRLSVVAMDRSREQIGFKSNQTDCYVNLIRPINRFVLVLENKLVNEVVDQSEKYRQALQDAIGEVVLIERIEAKRTDDNGNIDIERQATDVTFVVAQKQSPYVLYNTTDAFAVNNILGRNGIEEIKDKIRQGLDGEVEAIRLPHENSVILRDVMAKSYTWWLDDPWAALIALAAIIILLAIVGIIVIVFTHSRYMKFIYQYRVYQSTYDNPDFVEPPNFLREYETQSLNMYVPPDELAIPDYGEVDMTLGGEGVSQVQYTGQDPRVAAAVNPTYVDGDQSGQQQLAKSKDGGAWSDHLTNL
ncbi:protocadherin fat 4 [Plakobranchus ocellatus]|uniref:Protocadherin fat 4 n=1 Tax=Plakobranchus ocellatus TaxID=259542 RepID=A0AAV3YBI8_9GAST|nr:protocadherin fat 4 [Plakobranchus ocellatus]